MSYQTRIMQGLMPHHLFFTLFLLVIVPISQAFNEIERISLMSLPFNQSSPPLNWSSIDYCQWEGITCDANNRVTHIWLPYKGLRGTLSASLGNLTYLSHLNLSHNSLSGYLPKGMFSSLIQLKFLDLSYNGLIGPIPSFPFTNSSFGHFGQIPWGLGACSKLKVFRVGFNSLSGILPQDIYSAMELEEISLPSNRLSGPISSEIGNLTKLISLELQQNELSGQIPLTIGELSKLKYLQLSSNSLIGCLPPSLVNCTNLQILMLRLNLLEEDISTFNFSSLRQLTKIDLGVNHFFGNIPMSLYSCKSLVALRLGGNRLEGQITIEVVQLKFLYFLSLAGNRLTNITGAFKILKRCKCLSVLLLGGAFLRETMPCDDNIVGSDGFQNLQLLDLGLSKLTGQLPKWLSFLINLEVLNLAYNDFTGSLPSWLSTLPRLFRLDLQGNLISGEFPKELCTMPALVSVEAPRERTYLSLPLFSSGLEYNFPSNMKPAIYLSFNHLTGIIPIEIGHLKGLHALSLCGNNFSGTIPNQISKLTNLEKLDFSSNQFSGEIPASIVKLSFLSYFNVAFNDLHGRIPSGTQLQSFNVFAYEGNQELCGPPLQECAVIMKNDGEKYIQNEHNGFRTPWFLSSIVLGFIVGFCGACGLLLFNNKLRVAYFQFLGTIKDWF